MLSLKKILPSLLHPLLYLNMAFMAAGAIWIGLLAQWQVIGIGIIAIFF